LKVLIHNHDMLLKTKDPNGIEIGSLPKGAGLDHMRWDGNKLIDLLNLDKIWVEYINGSFRLHCIEVPHSQLVSMQYKDRKKLWTDIDGVYKLKSNEQIQDELNFQYRRSHYPQISDQIGAIMKYLKTKNDLPDELQELVNIVDDVKNNYPKMEIK